MDGQLDVCIQWWTYFSIKTIKTTGTANIGNGAHGTKKLPLETQVSEDFAYWSESNNTINIKPCWRYFKERKDLQELINNNNSKGGEQNQAKQDLRLSWRILFSTASWDVSRGKVLDADIYLWGMFTDDERWTKEIIKVGLNPWSGHFPYLLTLPQ
jgi:hypothetical protein